MTNLQHTKQKKTLINIKYCIAAFRVASYVVVSGTNLASNGSLHRVQCPPILLLYNYLYCRSKPFDFNRFVRPLFDSCPPTRTYLPIQSDDPRTSIEDGAADPERRREAAPCVGGPLLHKF